MRVLLVAHNSLPHHRAGVESYTHQLARELGRSHEVLVAATRKVISRATGTIRRHAHDGVHMVEVIQNLDGETFASTWQNEPMEAAFETVLRDWRPDVVHFQHVLYWSARLPAIAAAAGARVVFSLHDFFLMCGRMGQLIDHTGASCDGPAPERCAPCLAAFPWGQSPEARRWIRRLTAFRRATGVALDGPLRALQRLRTSLAPSDGARRAGAPGANADVDRFRGLYQQRTDAYRGMAQSVDVFVTASRTLRDRFVAWGLPAERLRLVPQGLDGAPFANVRRQPGNCLRLGFVGTIAPHKGLLDLIRAVAQLPADRVQLTVHGRADQHPAYAEQCREAASTLPNVRFAGWLKRPEIPRAYERIDVLCVPSRWDECAPLTIQESFLAGAPCVVSGRGGLAELVTDGVDGLYARAGDVDDWARVLRRLLDEPGLLPRLCAGIRPVPTVADHVAALTRLYVP